MCVLYIDDKEENQTCLNLKSLGNTSHACHVLVNHAVFHMVAFKKSSNESHVERVKRLVTRFSSNLQNESSVSIK